MQQLHWKSQISYTTRTVTAVILSIETSVPVPISGAVHVQIKKWLKQVASRPVLDYPKIKQCHCHNLQYLMGAMY
jgi:hypothetical protein